MAASHAYLQGQIERILARIVFEYVRAPSEMKLFRYIDHCILTQVDALLVENNRICTQKKQKLIKH
jgi:hypothetical protein